MTFNEYLAKLDAELAESSLPTERIDITLSPLAVIQIDEAGRRARDTQAYKRQMSTHQRYVDPMQARVMAELSPEDAADYARLYCADRSHPKWRDRTDCGEVPQQGRRLSIGWAMFGVTCLLLAVFWAALHLFGGR